MEWSVLKAVLGVSLLVAVVVMHFYLGGVLHRTDMASVFHQGGMCMNVVAHIRLYERSWCNSCIYLCLQGVVS